MAEAGRKLTEIKRQLTMLPEHKLDEVSDFIGFLLSQQKTPKRKIAQLEGIWKGVGFEKLNLQKEIKKGRKQLSKSILKKSIHGV